jgi:cell division protein FtsI/penicillin-binding protein 2
MAMRTRIFSENEYDNFEERRQTGRRLDIFRLVVLAIFLLFGARLFWMQVVKHETYSEMARQNRLRLSMGRASRRD